MKQKIFFMLFIFLFSVLISSPAYAEKRFNDLTYSKWAEEPIYYLYDRGTIAGLGNGKFGPTQTITRAQAVAFLVRELYPDEVPTTNLNYVDVPKHHYFYNDVAIAASKGLVGGYPDQTFRPNDQISRAETTAILTRAYSFEEGISQPTFQDIDGNWAYDSIKLLASNSLIGGYPDQTFKPRQSVTRAEFAAFLARSIQFKRSEAIEKKDWDELLTYMTLKEKVGQMLMPEMKMWQGKNTYYMNEGTSYMIKHHLVGGVILFNKNIQNIEQVTTLNHQIQNEAYDIPLFISIDQEGGVVHRIPNGTNFPGNMALGATRDPKLSYEAGKVTGAELKALGVNLNFAPVLDININPNNPIIGIRSYGADPDLVSEHGIEFASGLRHSGVIPTAKHFPGHGDTDVDSHLGLPLLPHSRQRLEEVELKPFRHAINNGIDMIMTAHVTFPAIDNTTVKSKKDGKDITIPATLSKKVVTDLLRREMGYNGVVITDAFTMKAISEHFGEENAAIMAVQAGVDIVLMPLDVEKTSQSVIQAARIGKVSKQTIDESVIRILHLKDKYQLFEKGPTLTTKIQNAKQIVGSKEHAAIEQEIASRSITLVKNEQQHIPYTIKNQDRIVLVTQTQQQATLISNVIKKDYPTSVVETYTIGQSNSTINTAIQRADFLILAPYQFRSQLDHYNWNQLQQLVNTTNQHSKKYVVLSLGNPYELMFVNHVQTYIAAYGDREPNIKAALDYIFKAGSPTGQLPVSVE